MESKLREMEAALQAKERSTGSIITARRDMSQQPAVAPPPSGSGLGGADGLPSLTASSRSPGASSSTNGQDDPSNTSSVTSSVSSITGSNSSSRVTMNNALSTGRRWC
ncbi:hypothetical protein HaLaN_05620 [Haematococcus lacustris]|uniref:Uncharacterized protein n=1 Tax=Haematococcus lacustris TaxID=44745 RepID=A0A699YV34_HAELA|nr:hypothetical protein HaLaN_05620 [Haematococcus lacustris]